MSRIVLCHGVFDILHIGHHRHLREARSFGERLVVSITAAAFVTKGPGRPACCDQERAEQLLDLRFVDDVFVSHDYTGAAAIRFWRPAVYVKGADYAARGVCLPEREACAATGAVIRYTTAVKRSVTELVESYGK